MPEDVNHREQTISAQEVACFAYCPEQWRLQYEFGLPPENSAALAAGTRHHARNTFSERAAGVCLALGSVVLAGAVLVLVLWAMRQWG